MIVFELTMPNRGSWNGKWSGEDNIHIIVKKESQVPKEVVGESFTYQWDDGWTAMITAKKMKSSSVEYKYMVKHNAGFMGYNWMVNSIIKHGEIRKDYVA